MQPPPPPPKCKIGPCNPSPPTPPKCRIGLCTPTQPTPKCKISLCRRMGPTRGGGRSPKFTFSKNGSGTKGQFYTFTNKPARLKFTLAKDKCKIGLCRRSVKLGYVDEPETAKCKIGLCTPPMVDLGWVAPPSPVALVYQGKGTQTNFTFGRLGWGREKKPSLQLAERRNMVMGR